MVHQSKVRRSDDEDVPLLSEDGRKFVDGNIDAEDYIQSARRKATEIAERDLDRHLPQRRPLRLSVLIVLIIAALAYAVLGVVSFGSRGNESVGPVALITSGCVIVAAVLTRYLDGGKHRGTMMSSHLSQVLTGLSKWHSRD